MNNISYAAESGAESGDTCIRLPKSQRARFRCVSSPSFSLKTRQNIMVRYVMFPLWTGAAAKFHSKICEIHFHRAR